MRPFHRALLAGLLFAAAIEGAFFPARLFAAERAAVVKELAIALGPTVYRIKQLEAQGTTLSEAELARLFDQKDATPARERFARLNAAKIIIPEIAGEAEAIGVKQNFVYRDVILENVKSGRIGAFRAASFAQTIDRPSGGRIEAHFDKIAINNIDLAQIVHVYGDARADANEALKSLQEETIIESASYAIPDARLELRIGRIAMKGLKARSFSRPPSNWFTEPSEAAAPAAERSAIIALAALDAIGGSEIGRFEARDVVASGVASGLGGKPFTLKLGRVELTNLANSVVGDLSIEDFSFAGVEAGDVKLRRLALRGLELRPFFEQSDRRFPRLAHAEFIDFEADLPDPANGDGARDKFRVGAGAADFGAYRDGTPTKLALKVDHWIIDVAARAGAPADAQLVALGYKDLDLSGAFDGEWREKEQEFVIRQATLDGRDMGRLQLAATLTNVAGMVFSANSALARAAALTVLVKRVEASFENLGLVDKTLALEAKNRRTDAAKLQADYASTAEAAISALFDGSEKGRLIGGAVAKFVAAPKQLRLRLESAKGVGALDAMTAKPGEILQGLDVDAKANQ
jgi:hypothetical protein